ncbi:MAG: hypothetical protein IPQ13_08240 [Holophagaceae bacterium]|nr:hypothetical protein [Holophagaceae bacterium]
MLTSGTIPNGFYNPWLGAVPSPATYTVAWAPIRIQYQLGRYLYCFTGQPNAYNFPLKVEDQYTLSNTAAVNIFPIFGTVKFFNSRFRFRLDDGSDEGWAAPYGAFNTSGNFVSSYSDVATTRAPRYTFNYLPIGVSAAAGNAEALTSSGTSTYGSNLFGRANPTVSGAPASGYGSYAGGYFAPGQWGTGSLLTAGNWHTLDGLNTNAGAGSNATLFLSPGNPLNSLFNAASKAAAVVGTGSGAANTYTQFVGSNAAPITISIPAEPYSNNEADARVIPSNSPYLFNVTESDYPYAGDQNHASGGGYDGFDAPRYMDLPHPGTIDRQHSINHSLNSAYVRGLPFAWVSGCAQSEVNVQRVLAGRPVFLADATDSSNIDNNAVSGANAYLRLSFTWPTLVTNSAAGYPASGSANTWGTTDVMQVATPNMSGRARFFFTGNYIGTSESDATNFWKLGFAQSTGLTFTGTGVTAAPSQPIQAVTNSLWVPALTNGHFNLLNTLTTPAGGSGYTDIPFAAIRGYVDTGISYQGINGAAGQQAILPDAQVWAQARVSDFMGLNSQVGSRITPVNNFNDENVNPALIDTGTGDNSFFLWMKQDPTIVDAYGTYAGSYLSGGVSTTLAVGGHTAAPSFDMLQGGSYGLTDTQSQISFSEIGTQLGGVNQSINSGIGMTGWNITQFEQLRSLVAAPAQYGNAPRARLVDPAMATTGSDNTLGTFDTATAPTFDGIVSNSLIVYAIQNRGTDAYGNSLLGEAGIEPGAPVLAQWWNNLTHADAATADFPEVLLSYTSSFLPSGYQEVVELKHNFIAKLMHPAGGNVAGTAVQKVVVSTGIIAPKGDALLTNAIPVVTPVRQLAINDMKINTATGSTVIGTKLDIFNGTADPNPAGTGLTFGTPLGGIPSYKLASGNAPSVPASDYRIHGDSNIQLTWQPAVNDLRNPSGYEVTIYRMNGVAEAYPVHKITMGHKGGIGAIQTLNLPSFRALVPTSPLNTATILSGNQAFAVKVRNLWMNGNEGPDSKGFDLAKEPFATRFPMAWADCVSGVFVVNYGATAPVYAPIAPGGPAADVDPH